MTQTNSKKKNQFYLPQAMLAFAGKLHSKAHNHTTLVMQTHLMNYNSFKSIQRSVINIR